LPDTEIGTSRKAFVHRSCRTRLFWPRRLTDKPNMLYQNRFGPDRDRGIRDRSV